ncbi:MAG: hypothetical protein HUK28_07105, partial [Methanobrevibacter sp.]|nr:hypothetical protein [Methanobrevibacter sp.]
IFQNNNLFGWNAYDDSPSDASEFSSVDVCVKEQMGRNLRGYLDVKDSRFTGSYVGNKGGGFNLNYASDPYWGMKIASIYYSLDKYANNNNGKLSDYDTYTIGLVKTYNTNIYLDQNLKTPLYNTINKRSYQYNYTVIVLEKIGNVYKIQTSNPIKDNSLVLDYSTGVKTYDFNTSIGYIKCSDVDILFDKDVVINDDDLTHETFISLDDVNFKDNKLELNGIAGFTSSDFIDLDNISHYLQLYKIGTNELAYEFKLETIDSYGFSLNDQYNYKYTGFKLSLDLTNTPIDLGSYYAKIEVNNNNVSMKTLLKSMDLNHCNVSSKVNDVTYRISTNGLYSYRIDLDVEKTVVDYSKINKPSARPSLATIDSVNIDNNTLTIKGYGFVHYLNFDNVNDLKYELYLVDVNGNNYKLETKLEKRDYDWNKIISSNYKQEEDDLLKKFKIAKIEALNNLVDSIKKSDGNGVVELKIEYELIDLSKGRFQILAHGTGIKLKE